MCSRCVQLDEMVTRLKRLENPTMDLHLSALVRITIEDLEQRKRQLPCESAEAVSIQT